VSTIISSTADLGAALTAALTERGLQVEPVPPPQAAAALGGPLLVIRLPLRADTGAEVSVVAVDRGQDNSGEQVVQALAQTIAGKLGELVVGDASMEACPGLDPVLGAFTAPAEVGLVVRGGAPVGAVLWSVDRRASATPPPAAAPAVPNAPAVAAAPAGATFEQPGPPGGHRVPSFGGGASIALLRDVHLDVSVELGRTVMTVAEVLELSVGAVVELDRAARAPVDIRVNGTLLAKGEVVVIDDEYAVRVTEILDPDAGPAS
jgi:flagellar motor switch protein FliN